MTLVVLVNGLPGSGKTTLARELAPALGLMLLSKDAIKETLADHLPGEGPAWSRALGVAALETVWTLLRDARCGALLEAPWLVDARGPARAGLERAGVATHTVHEVWCDVPAGVARERVLARIPDRHVVHGDTRASVFAKFEKWEPLAHPLEFGAVHRVDTRAGVDVEALARRITSATAGFGG